MPTTIRVTRQTPFTKSDDLREDVDLFTEAEALGAWLAERSIETVTMNEVLLFAQVEHEEATLENGPIEYMWLWDDVNEEYHVVCINKGRVSYLLTGQSDAVVIEIVISATY